MSRKLPNYVRTYRRRTGLSQDEVAFLLGCNSGTKVSRYERFARLPSLETAFAYQAIFGVPMRELFGGVYEQELMKVHERAHQLVEMFKKQPRDQSTTRKLECLRAIASSSLLNQPIIHE
jgi:transcriptional regulator with XRE-family HTH domain